MILPQPSDAFRLGRSSPAGRRWSAGRSSRRAALLHDPRVAARIRRRRRAGRRLARGRAQAIEHATRDVWSAFARSTARRRSCIAPAIAPDRTPSADADIIVARRSVDWRSRSRRRIACRCSSRDRRTGAVAAAHAGWRGMALRVPASRSTRSRSEFGSRPADLMAARRAVDWRVLLRGRRRRARALRERGLRATQLARWFLARARVVCRQSADAVADRRRGAANHWFFDGWQRRARSAGSSRRAARTRSSSRSCARRATERVCSYRRDGRRGARHDMAGGRSGAAASSIALLASRSAWALSARPTCSKLTRPISCASSRALRVERLQARVLHLVAAEHLLNEQQRIGADVQGAMRRARAPIRARPAGRDIRRRCWWRRQSTRRTPRPACRRAARRARRNRPARDFPARRRRCTRRRGSMAMASRCRLRHGSDAVGRRRCGGIGRRGCAGSCRTGRSRSLRRTLLNTCGRSRTWQIVQMPSRASATATPLRRWATASKMPQHLRVQRRDDRRRARRTIRSSDGFSSACSAAIFLRSASTVFCSAASSPSARFACGGELVGFEHALEDLVLERLDLALREVDFLLDGVRIPDWSSPPSPARGTSRAGPGGRATSFSIVAPRLLVVGEPLLGGRDALARRLEARVERLLLSGSSGEPARRRRAPRSRAAAAR